MGKLHIKVKKLSPNAVMPSFAKEGDMCMDITAISVEYDEKKDAYIYHTGLAFESPMGAGSLLFCRSSNCKTDCYLPNHVGVADIAGYRGEILFVFKNRTSYKTRCLLNTWEASYTQGQFVADYIQPDPMEFAPYKVGDRIGQIMFVNLPQVEIEEVEHLSDSERGTGGFGSTGA